MQDWMVRFAEAVKTGTVFPAVIAAIGVLAFVGTLFFWSARVARADTVVTTCTAAGIQAALNAGGIVTFNCGAGPVTIPITPTLVVSTTVTLDGGSKIALDGGGLTRIITMTSGSALTLTNITLQNGNAMDGDGGGAVNAPTGTLKLTSINTTYRNNRAIAGPSLNGGAIFSFSTNPVDISSSTFISNAAFSGGGAAALLANVTGTTFISNTAFNAGGFAVGFGTITGSTFISNTAVGGGGGLVAAFASITGTSFISNTAFWGGGGVYSVGDSSISGSTFVSNTGGAAGVGGAIYSVGTVTMTGTSIISNTAVQGGGVAVLTATVDNSTILSNTATGSGGGLYSQWLTLRGTTVAGNTAPGGGGVYVLLTATVDNSSVVSNTASVLGGGLIAQWLALRGTTVVSNTAPEGAGVSVGYGQIINSTLAGNNGPAGSAVLFFQSLAMTNTTVLDTHSNVITGFTLTLPFTLTDSIVAGASAPLCSHAGTLLGKNVIQDTSCGTGGALIQADPQLGPLQDNGGPTWTMAPQPGSPAIGASPACQVTVDQRGASRTAPCDLGAYETGAAPALISLIPATAVVHSPAFTLTITGTGFISGTVALWQGSERPTTVLNPSTLLVAIPGTDLATAGAVTVTARYGQAADSVSNGLPFSVEKKSQTITFGPLANRTLGDAPFTVSASASSGLAVSFSASGSCTVAGNTVSLVSVGTCTITASQSGDGEYAAAPSVPQAFQVLAPTATATATSTATATATPGGSAAATATPTATVGPGGTSQTNIPGVLNGQSLDQ